MRCEVLPDGKEPNWQPIYGADKDDKAVIKSPAVADIYMGIAADA